SRKAGAGPLLTMALPDDGARRAAAAAAVSHGFGTDAFWKALPGDTQREAVKRAATLAGITGNHAPLLERLVGSQRTTRELAAFDVDDWTALLAQENVAPPEGVTVANYAKALRAAAAAAHPSASLAGGIARKGLPGKAAQVAQPLVDLLARHPEYEL